MTHIAATGSATTPFTETREGPVISVIVVFARRFEVLRRTLAHLRAQTIADRIELIVVAPSASAMRGRRERDTAGFHSVHVVTSGEIVNIDKAGALAVHAATAPVVAFIEDHAFPAPDWAERIVAAHAGPWDVVGTAIDNGNPATGSSWANHLVTYGPWLPITTPGERDSVSRHNSSFKREALRALGDGLTTAFGRDATLLKDLRRAGHRIYLEPRTSVAHVSPSRVSTTLWLRFHAGKIFASKRVVAGRWGLPKRVLFAAASPVYPFIRFRQIWQQSFGHATYRGMLPRVLPALGGALVADALGQAAGYLAGGGRSVDLLADFEAERAPHLVPSDLPTLLDDEDGAMAVQQPARAPAEVRIGIIGCGRVVQLAHLRTLASLPGSRLVAIAEPDDERRAAASARAAGARAYADWRELLRDPEVDAVLIAAPPSLHAEMAVAAFEAGKHVYLEKPIAPSLAESARIVDAWRASEPARVGMIGHNLRCHPIYHAARNLIEQGRIGRPVLVRTAFTAASRELPAWKLDLAEGGGVVLDLATHHVDLCRFLLAGDVASVALEEWEVGTPGHSALMTMRMQSGLRVESFFSLGAVSDDQCEITGDKGRIVIDRYTGDLRVLPARQPQHMRARLGRETAGIVRAVRRVIQPPGEPSYRIAMERFVRAIRDGGVALPDLDDGHRALELVLQARRDGR